MTALEDQPNRDDLLVTDEYFDYLVAESDRPAREPTAAMVALLRATRGSVEHR